MLKITRGVLKFAIESIFTHPTRTRLRAHAYRLNQLGCCAHRRQYAFTIRAAPLWNKLPADVANASSVKSFKTLLDAKWLSMFLEVPV